MEKINFTDAILTAQAKVTIDGTDHEITPAVYTGGTDLDASTFNTMQNNIEDCINTTQTDIEDYVNNKFNYSTTEQVVGTWIDGKPLYRKTLTGTSNVGEYTINHDVSNLEIGFVGQESFVYTAQDGFVPANYTNDITTKLHVNNCRVKTNGIQYYIGSYIYSTTTVNYVFTIYYTKTTD